MKKLKLVILFSVLTIALFTISCASNIATNTLPGTSSVVPVTFTPAPVVSLLTHQEAFEQMYGKDLNISSTGEAFIISAEGIKYSIEMNVFSCYWDASNIEICLVLTDRSQCRGCGSYIDGAIFNRADSNWKLLLLIPA